MFLVMESGIHGCGIRNPRLSWLTLAILDLSFMSLITKATRITNYTSTLIDHIYTNVPEKIIKAGICVADISDHLPIFLFNG